MLDLAIVVAFVVYAVASGLRAKSAASRNLQEYFLAGKSIPGWKSGMSMAATQFAADTPLLVTGLIATAGVFALWRLWVYALAFLLMAFVFSGAWRRGGVLTDAELTETRYSGRGVLPLRVLKAIYYGTIINCIVMAMVLVAAIRIAEVFLPWHEWLPGGVYAPIVSFVEAIGLRLGESVTGLSPEVATTNNLISILLILAFTATYSTTGGLRSVVNTDVVQLVLAMVGTAAYAWFVLDHVGGFSALSDRVVEIYGEDKANEMLSFGPVGAADIIMPFLIIISLQWFFQMNSDGTGYLAQRSMACRTDKDARIAGVVFTWTQIFLRSLFWLVIAVGLLVVYPFTPEQAGGTTFTAEREMLFVTGVDELMPPGLRGLMLTGLLAALASTVDTHLNWGASYWSNDVYDRFVCRELQKREPSGRELVVVARLSNLLILGIALVIMANLGSIQTAWFISLLFGAGMGSVLVLRWLWERINLWSELAAMAASIIVAPILLFTMGTDPADEWVRLLIMALVTTGAAICVTFITPPTDQKTLLAFYERVQPYGWWGKTAALAGDRPEAPREALRMRTQSLLVTAASLFFLLLGVGRLLVQAPDASIFWSWTYVVIGLALIPLWWRDVARDDQEFDRSARPDDVEVNDSTLLRSENGLLASLQQLAAHMRIVYGMDVTVESRGLREIKEEGRRILMFEVVQNLLIHMAGPTCTAPVRVVLDCEGESYRIDILLGAPTDFGEPARGVRRDGPTSTLDVLGRAAERLGHVCGRFEVLPNRRQAERLVLTAHQTAVPTITSAAE